MKELIILNGYEGIKFLGLHDSGNGPSETILSDGSEVHPLRWASTGDGNFPGGGYNGKETTEFYTKGQWYRLISEDTEPSYDESKPIHRSWIKKIKAPSGEPVKRAVLSQRDVIELKKIFPEIQREEEKAEIENRRANLTAEIAGISLSEIEAIEKILSIAAHG